MKNLVKNGVNVQLVIKKSSAESLNAYCLILEDASYIIKVINGQMTCIEKKNIVYIYKNERVDSASEIRKHC